MCNIKKFMIVVCATGLLVGGCSEGRDNGLTMRSYSQQNGSSASEVTSPSTTPSNSDSGILFGYVKPTDPRYDISLSEIQAHVRDNTAVFIDARGPADYALGHIRGALNMPAGLKEAYLSKILENVSPDQLLIIYCNGPYCDSSDTVFEYLATNGFSNMKIFKPGWRGLSADKSLR